MARDAIELTPGEKKAEIVIGSFLRAIFKNIDAEVVAGARGGSSNSLLRIGEIAAEMLHTFADLPSRQVADEISRIAD